MWDSHQNRAQPNGGDLVLTGDKRQGEQNHEMWDSHQNTAQPNGENKVSAGDKQQEEQNYEMWDSNGFIFHALNFPINLLNLPFFK